MRSLLGLCLALLATGAIAATPAEKSAVMRTYVDLLRYPNVADKPADMRRLADRLVEEMAKRGLSPRLLEGGKDTPPAVYGEWRVPGATRTLILYAHYDGQPADPADWRLAPPFEPTFRSGRPGQWSEPFALPPDPLQWNDDWRVFARSASDDKLGVMAILAAVDRLKATGGTPAFNLKIFLDGEEEAGSPGLPAILATNRDLLGSDGWVIFDGPAHANGAAQVVLGVRGAASVDITVYGANRGLHSGHYGNWAPNPALRLSRLLASMEAADGRVLIDGFYRDSATLTAADRDLLKAIPDDERTLRTDLGIAANDGTVSPAEAVTRTSLDILGIRSADVGAAARNVIPATATATLGVRLVKGDDFRRTQARIADHVRRQGYYVIDRAPTEAERLRYPLIATVVPSDGYNAERTPADDPLARTIVAAVRSVGPTVVLPTIGGSLPLAMIRDGAGAPSVTVSLANHDNNQHAEDENLRLGNLWRAIDVATVVMQAPAFD